MADRNAIQSHLSGGTRGAVEAALVDGEIGINEGTEKEAIAKGKTDPDILLHLISEERMQADPDGVQTLMGGPFATPADLPQGSYTIQTVSCRLFAGEAPDNVSSQAFDLKYLRHPNGKLLTVVASPLVLENIDSPAQPFYLKQANGSTLPSAMTPARAHEQFFFYKDETDSSVQYKIGRARLENSVFQFYELEGDSLDNHTITISPFEWTYFTVES